MKFKSNVHRLLPFDILPRITNSIMKLSTLSVPICVILLFNNNNLNDYLFCIHFVRFIYNFYLLICSARLTFFSSPEQIFFSALLVEVILPL